MKAFPIQLACWHVRTPLSHHETLRTWGSVFHPRRAGSLHASAPSAHVPVGVRGWASFVASNSTNMYRREKDALEVCVKVLQKGV